MINRRNFLKNFGMAGAVLAVPGTVAKAAAAPARINRDITNIRLKGKVHTHGKPMAGVAVTDGINVTTTGKNGTYELLSNNTAEFVYISIPAGYAFTNEKGIARFYQPVVT